MMEIEVGDVVIMKGAVIDSVEFRRATVKEVYSVTFLGYFLTDKVTRVCELSHISEEETKLYQSRYGSKFTGLLRTVDKTELSTDQGDETL